MKRRIARDRVTERRSDEVENSTSRTLRHSVSPSLRHSVAFTLIELLVVVTIIIVLLALLVPAMEKAIYRAELVMCGTRLRGMATAVLDYATGNNRVYPDRSTLNSTHWKWPALVAETDHGLDIRPLLKDYMPLKMYQCPFTPKVSFEVQDTSSSGATAGLAQTVFSPYNLWFGLNYAGQRGMRRMGDRVEFLNAGIVSRFSVLASDQEQIGASYTWSAHQDKELMMTSASYQAVPTNDTYPGHVMTWTRWYMPGQRKTMDRNYVMDDLSVRFFDKVVPEDERLTPIGVTLLSTGAGANDATWEDLLPSVGQ